MVVNFFVNLSEVRLSNYLIYRSHKKEKIKLNIIFKKMIY